MLIVDSISPYEITFQTDNVNLIAAVRPLRLDNQRFFTTYWVPYSEYILHKLLSYEYNEQLALALQKHTNQLAEFHFNAKQNHHPTLRDYQKLGVERIKHDNHLLIWEMQTGKTATVCNAISNMKRVVILIEKGHEYKWMDELKKFANRTDVYLITAAQPEATRNDLLKELNDKETYVVISTAYMLAKASGFFKLKHIDELVIDEGHWLTNPKTQRTINAYQLRANAKRVCILTGTPTNKNPNEILEIFKFMYKTNHFVKSKLNPYFFEANKNYYSGYPDYTKLLPERTEEWKSYLENYSSNVLMFENLKPVVKRISHYLKLHPDHRALYEKLKRSYQYGDITLNHIVEVIVRTQQMALCPQLLQLDLPAEHEAKWVWLLWYLKQNPYEQIILFTPFTSYLEIIQKRLNDLGYKTACLTGKDSAKNRNSNVKAFQNKQIQILLANTIAGSKGWTLNQADTIIFLSRDWSPINNDQAEARFNASGFNVNPNKKIIDLICDDTIDISVINVINKKWDKTKVVNEYIKLLKEQKT